MEGTGNELLPALKEGLTNIGRGVELGIGGVVRFMVQVGGFEKLSKDNRCRGPLEAGGSWWEA